MLAVRRSRGLLATLVVCLCLPAHALGDPSVKLNATLTPELLGHGTTVGFGFQITEPGGGVPPPVTAVELRYPRNLGIALSELGLSTCRKESLEALGGEGCPTDSRMGYGSAIAAIPVGPEVLHETAQVEIFRAPTQEGHIGLLFYATGQSPVDAQILFDGLLLPTPLPFGGGIHLNIPLVPSLPEASNVAVVGLHSTIGPEHITYFERRDGKQVAYRPKGVLLPNTCPPGGFPFAAEFAFENGSQSSARTTVPCPKRQAAHHS